MVGMGVYNTEQGNYDKEELEALLSNMPAGVAIENEDHEILYMNGFLLRMFGNQVGEKCFVGFTGRDTSCDPCPVDVIIKEGQDTFRQTVASRDGKFFEITASPIHNPDGSRSVIEIVKDVTDQHKLDQMKSDFIHIVAHEMRTPLAAVIGFNDMLSRRSEGFTYKQKHYIESIAINARKMKQLVDDILDLSYLDAGILKLKRETLPLEELVSEVLATHQALIAEKNHKIRVNIPELLTIECDRQKITRTMSNIVFNAVYYTDINGTIGIDIDNLADEILITVTDNGIGISEQDRSQIFDRFFMADATLTRSCDRIGIGLTLAKGYVQLHGGEIWVESEIEEGSAFYFTLPKYKIGDNNG